MSEIWKGCILIMGCCVFSLSSMAAQPRSLYSQSVLNPRCQPAYEQGVAAYNQSVDDQLTPVQRRDYLDRMARAYRDSCAFEYGMGAFDAQYLLMQKILLEYGLEYWYEQQFYRGRPVVLNRLKSILIQRIRHAGLNVAATLRHVQDGNFYEHVIPQFIKHMKMIAAKHERAIPFGRFVFVSGPSWPVFTLYDWQLDEQGRWLFDSQGKAQVVAGSYQRAALQLARQAEALIKEYLDWEPGIFWGKDSFWRGAFWRYFYGLDQKTVREQKEDQYYQRMLDFLRQAKDLNLDEKPYFKMAQMMLKKQRAYLQRDLEIYRRTQIALYSAPLIPVGMAVGAAGLTYAGLVALPAETVSFSLTTGSLAGAANVAALLSGSVLAGFAGYGIYEGIREQVDHQAVFKIQRFLDAVLTLTIQSFPIAAKAPVVVGATAAGLRYISISVPRFISQGFSLAKSLRSLGVKGALKEVPYISREAIRWWASTWWRNRRILGFNYLGNTISAFAFEIYSREFVLGGDSRLFPRDAQGRIDPFKWSEYNNQGLVSLSSGLIGGFLFQPATLMKSVWGRTLYAQALVLGSLSISQILVGENKTDFRQVRFGLAWNIGYARWRSEAIRPIYLSKFVTGHSAFRQVALTAAMNIVIGLVEAPVRNYLLDDYLLRGRTPVGKLRGLLWEIAQVKTHDFTDDEIAQAWQEYIRHVNIPGR